MIAGLSSAPCEVNFAVLPPDVHSALVTVELIQLVVAKLIVHSRVVDGESGEKILRVFRDDNH